MKRLQFFYHPEAELEFSKAEIAGLIWLSQHHYDHNCKAMSEGGGLLIRLVNQMKILERDSITEFVKQDRAQLLIKCLEQVHTMPEDQWPTFQALYGELVTVDRELSAEWCRLNHDESKMTAKQKRNAECGNHD